MTTFAQHALRLPVRLVTLLLATGLAASAQAGLINGGFEAPDYPANTVQFPLEGAVPGWNTTASDNVIEIWTTPFGGVSAYEGDQFAELNANQVSTLFQDVTGIGAGSIVGFQFAHRGRAGLDTMRFTLTDLGLDGLFGGGDDTQLFTNLYATGNSAWSFYTGTGIVALGNTVRFDFISVSAAGGPTVGNFLDAADFGVGVGVPEPASLTLLGLGLAGLLRRRR